MKLFLWQLQHSTALVLLLMLLPTLHPCKETPWALHVSFWIKVGFCSVPNKFGSAS